MTVVVCPELDYLEARERTKRGWHKWSPLEDAKLKEYTGFGVSTDLIALDMGIAERYVRQRQRALGIRLCSGRAYKR